MPMYNYICKICGRPGRTWRKEGHAPWFCSNACRIEGMRGVPCKKNKWVITPEMHRRIEQVYKTNTGNNEVNELAERLGLPRWKVTRYAMSHGWIAKQKGSSSWTIPELEVLQKLARYTPVVIQHRMSEKGYQRSINSIVLKLKRMKMRQNINGHSSLDVAQCLGVDAHFVTRAIKLGKLRATRRGTARTERQGGDHWYILDQNLRKYVFEYLDEIDIRKVDKYWFVDLIVPENMR